MSEEVREELRRAIRLGDVTKVEVLLRQAVNAGVVPRTQATVIEEMIREGKWGVAPRKVEEALRQLENSL